MSYYGKKRKGDKAFGYCRAGKKEIKSGSARKQWKRYEAIANFYNPSEILETSAIACASAVKADYVEAVQYDLARYMMNPYRMPFQSPSRQCRHSLNIR